MKFRNNKNALFVFCDYSCPQKCTLKKHIESLHEGKISYNCSTWDHDCPLKCTLGRHIESVHDNMTSCNCSICGHNFILKSDHNNSLKCTLKQSY